MLFKKLTVRVLDPSLAGRYQVHYAEITPDSTDYQITTLVHGMNPEATGIEITRTYVPLERKEEGSGS